jgi:hypothetical protein
VSVSGGSSGVFRWGQVFQRGDLPLYVTDVAGNPLGPYSVTYTMLYHPKTSPCVQRVCPEGRTPVQVDVGEYYASGIAGRCGQSGEWCIEWKLQEFFGGPFTTATYCFSVFDVSAYCPPGMTRSCGCASASSCGCHRVTNGCQYGCRNSCRHVYGWA